LARSFMATPATTVEIKNPRPQSCMGEAGAGSDRWRFEQRISASRQRHSKQATADEANHN
jgi:hypothetical protein